MVFTYNIYIYIERWRDLDEGEMQQNGTTLPYLVSLVTTEMITVSKGNFHIKVEKIIKIHSSCL